MMQNWSIPRLRRVLDLPLAGALLATSLAASSAPVNDGALRAIAATRGIALCAHEGHTSPMSYARSLFLKEVTLADGTSIAVFEGGCESGNDNDAIYIVAAHGSQTYKVVSTEYGFLEKLDTGGRLVLMTNPGGVDVRYQETQHWNGSTFGPPSGVMVWVKTGESKPATVPFTFAPGTSSATVTGTVREDFPDVYEFDARPGQTMSVDVRPRSGSIGRLEISVVDGAYITSGTALSWHGTLPEATHTVFLSDDRADEKPGGHYEIKVDGAGEKRATYAMTVSIR